MLDSPWLSRLGYAPLFPVAVAVTVGVVTDRYLAAPTFLCLLLAASSLLAGFTVRKSHPNSGWLYQAVAWAGLAAAYHHFYRESFPENDIGAWLAEEQQLVQVRGVLDEEPVVPRQLMNHPLISIPRVEHSWSVLKLRELRLETRWTPVSGKVRLVVDGRLEGLHLGDEVELLGWLSRPREASNPGESDPRERLLDERIRAELHVRKTPESVVRVELGWRSSLFAWLAQARTRGQQALAQQLPEEEAQLAMALLLGENTSLTADEWQQYVRTGVIHVLAISGQHLVVLGIFLSCVLRLFGFGTRRIAWIVGLTLLTYAVLTGARPSALRAAIMVGVICVAILLRERIFPANAFALSWVVVLAMNPTELFHPGFQLSFLAVAILVWGMPNWFPPREPTPQEELIDEFRPMWSRVMHSILVGIGGWYRITFVLAIATAPLVIYWQHIVSPIGLLIGPPMLLLSSVALISGFGLLLSAMAGGFLSLPFRWVTEQSLTACHQVVKLADSIPGGSLFVGTIPEWWLVGFYSIGVVWLLWATLQKASTNAKLLVFGREPRSFVFVLLLLGWGCLGFVRDRFRPPLDEVRITFLAVGHGGCTVVETPDGRTLLYDAGVVTGPEVTRRVIAPFLWERGIRHLDEVFLSHGDLDHFNGLPSLLERFTIGQVTLTPTFRDKPTAGVSFTLRELEKHRIPLRVAQAGDTLHAGELRIDVLHPPANGPDGIENARSMVLLLKHFDHRILLTGDLEKEGLARVLSLPRVNPDVLMAPHHGSKAANTDELRDWASPKLVVSCEGIPRTLNRENTYVRKSIPYWMTHEHGAITLHSHRTGLVAKAYRSKERLVVKRGSGER